MDADDAAKLCWGRRHALSTPVSSDASPRARALRQRWSLVPAALIYCAIARLSTFLLSLLLPSSFFPSIHRRIFSHSSAISQEEVGVFLILSVTFVFVSSGRLSQVDQLPYSLIHHIYRGHHYAVRYRSLCGGRRPGQLVPGWHHPRELCSRPQQY